MAQIKHPTLEQFRAWLAERPTKRFTTRSCAECQLAEFCQAWFGRWYEVTSEKIFTYDERGVIVSEPLHDWERAFVRKVDAGSVDQRSITGAEALALLDEVAA